jgi:hypothetical protein
MLCDVFWRQFAILIRLNVQERAAAALMLMMTMAQCTNTGR